MGDLKQEFNYYLENQGKLVKLYEGKFIVIKNKEVTGAFKSELEAYEESIKEYKEGTFLIQQCLPGEDSYTQTFHTRVIF